MNYYHFMRDSGQRKEDVRYFFGHEGSPGALPISIRVAGASRWVGDVQVERIRTGATSVLHVRVGRAVSPNASGTAEMRPDDAYPEALVIEQVTFGNACFAQNGKEYLVNPGGIFLQHPGGRHSYRTGPAGVLHKRFVEVRGPHLPSLLRTMGLIGCDVIHPDKPAAATAVLRRAFSLLAKKAPGCFDQLSLSAYELLMLLRRNLSPRYPSPVTAALSFIERNLNCQVTQQELCAAAEVSTTHLCRLFKRHLGVPPMKYLVIQRMAWAQRLLIDSSMSIKEVAAAIGCDDQLYFSAQFKRHAGISPKAFREARKG